MVVVCYNILTKKDSPWEKMRGIRKVFLLYLDTQNRKEENTIELKFEWDEEKAAINLKKHKVAFEDAIYVFQDDNRIEFYDAEHSDRED